MLDPVFLPYKQMEMQGQLDSPHPPASSFPVTSRAVGGPGAAHGHWTSFCYEQQETTGSLERLAQRTDSDLARISVSIKRTLLTLETEDTGNRSSVPNPNTQHPEGCGIPCSLCDAQRSTGDRRKTELCGLQIPRLGYPARKVHADIPESE